MVPSPGRVVDIFPKQLLTPGTFVATCYKLGRIGPRPFLWSLLIRKFVAHLSEAVFQGAIAPLNETCCLLVPDIGKYMEVEGFCRSVAANMAGCFALLHVISLWLMAKRTLTRTRENTELQGAEIDTSSNHQIVAKHHVEIASREDPAHFHTSLYVDLIQLTHWGAMSWWCSTFRNLAKCKWLNITPRWMSSR